MKVLVTGASGFLGRHALRALARCGIQTVSLGRRPPPGAAGEGFVRADLLEPDSLLDALTRAEATHLLHLAWITDYGQYLSSPLNLQWVDATTRLVDAFCRAGGKRVVVGGSCAEYDWSQGELCERTGKLDAATRYGAAKDACRRLTEALCAHHGVSHAWARIFFTYGGGEDRRRLVPSLIDALSGRRPVFTIDGAARRDFLHASDVARGLLFILRADAEGSFNVSCGHAVELAGLIQELASLLGASPLPLLSRSQARVGEYPLLVGDNRRLRALGWSARLDLREGLAATLAELEPEHFQPAWAETSP